MRPYPHLLLLISVGVALLCFKNIRVKLPFPRSVSRSMSSSAATSEELVPLKPHEARRYGHLGTEMEIHHSYMKREFNDLYEQADGSYHKRGMSLNMYLQSALLFQRHLHGHHTFEERYVFPILAKKMPTFKDDEQHRKSHKGIHEGLDSLVTLVSRFRADPTAYSPTEMRACLDGFREVLMHHLDEEVNDLRAENMRKYWSLEEVDSFPW